jgi:hypothetical protein
MRLNDLDGDRFGYGKMTASTAPPEAAPLSRSQTDTSHGPRLASRLADVSAAQFRLLMLGMAAAAALMAAEGVQSFAELAERNAVSRARLLATSPVPYRTVLPTLHAVAPGTQGTRVIVRADSAGAGEPALCALARASAGAVDVRWVALSPAVPACVASAADHAVVRAGPAAAGEMAGARWVVLDARGATLYSSRAVPDLQRLRTTAALLASAEPGRDKP